MHMSLNLTYIYQKYFYLRGNFMIDDGIRRTPGIYDRWNDIKKLSEFLYDNIHGLNEDIDSWESPQSECVVFGNDMPIDPMYELVATRIYDICGNYSESIEFIRKMKIVDPKLLRTLLNIS